MNPVAIFRFARTEGPGYFATYLSAHGIPWQVVPVDAGAAVPHDPRAFSGIALMGGPMSVNDELPWIAPLLSLIRAAAAVDVPVIGHCLGAQLLAKAMGGIVTRNPVKEIGWGRVDLLGTAEAGRWFGEGIDSFDSFHWHGETFSVPPGAARLASSPCCANQAFALGPHLGMQFHVEMTPELIRAWCRDWEKEVARLAERVPSVQTPAEMVERVDERTRALNAIADRVYGCWVKELKRE